MDKSHPISTPLEFGKKTNHYADGLAPIMSQAATEGDGPKFKSTLVKSEEMSTGHDLSR